MFQNNIVNNDRNFCNNIVYFWTISNNIVYIYIQNFKILFYRNNILNNIVSSHLKTNNIQNNTSNIKQYCKQ